MARRFLLLWIGIFSLTATVGCGSIENAKITDKTKVLQTSQKQVNHDIKSANIPGFEKIYKDTVEIEIQFDSNGVYWGEGKPVQIKDSKVISDIFTMIGQSTLITDESKIKNMSGMAAKNNRLIFTKKNGETKEITFAFDDPAFALGYLVIEGKKYDPGFSFLRYMKDFTEYRQFNANIDTKVVDLFKKYNWTVDYRINAVEEVLPINLKHEAGEYPTKIYWAYNNELSKSIGLDYNKFLGKKIDVEIYRLREPLPDFMKPYMDARGIVLKYNGTIIGAFIDAGRSGCFVCSLDRKNLKDITGKDWDVWISDYIDYDNELEMKLSQMKPEDIIKQYYEAMNSNDEKMLYACMTRKNACSYLVMNMNNNRLINEGFKSAYMDGAQNVKSVKLIKLDELRGMDNPKGTLKYEATADFSFKKVITSNNGIQSRFILLKKESEKSGWRISEAGTGP
ncbi:MAG: DUF4829 domain-containing protein [Clostridia bacterium]|nr:DUF4829 domain-containing protein [Clostridia bacterium]